MFRKNTEVGTQLTKTISRRKEKKLRNDISAHVEELRQYACLTVEKDTGSDK